MASRREVLAQAPHLFGGLPSYDSKPFEHLVGYTINNPSISRRRFVEVAAVAGAGLYAGACSDGIGPKNDAPVWQSIPDVAFPMNTQRADIPTINLEQYATDETPSSQLRYSIKSDTNPEILPLRISGNTLMPAGDLPRDAYGEKIVTLTVTDPEGLESTINVRYVVNKEAYYTFNLRDLIGSLDSEPLIQTKGRLILERQDRSKRLTIDDVVGTTRVQLGSGTWIVNYENQDYWNPWALIRQQGSDTNLSQSDIVNPWMALNVGLEDKVLDLYKIPTSFPLKAIPPETRSYFDIIFDNRTEPSPGITTWKPGLPMNIYIDTRAEVGGSGRVPSQEWVNAIREAAGLLRQIKTIGGKQVFENINVYVSNNPNDLPTPATPGTILVYADDSSLNVGGNGLWYDENGYVNSGYAHLRSWNSFVNDPLHELAQIVAHAASQRDIDLSVARTVYSRNGATSNFMPVDLSGNKIVFSFNKGAKFRA